MIKTYEVKGMTCIICKNTVEKGLKKLNGVTDCLVNLMDNEVTIDFDEKTVNESTFSNTLKELGYELVQNKKKQIDLNNIKLIVSCFLVVILMIISMSSMDNPSSTMYYQLFIASSIYLLNINYFVSGFNALMHLNPNMNSLVAISSIVSFLYSLYSIFRIRSGFSNTHLYFESGSMILVIVTLGKLIESRNKKKTTKAIRGLSTLIPMQANLIIDDDIKVIPIEELNKEDIVLVKAGESIPQDGIVIKGISRVNESLITGESQLTIKEEGSEAIGGTVNVDDELVIKITKNSTQTVLANIISLTKQATLNKIPIERLTDKISKYFVFGVIGISLLTFIIWIISSKDLELSLNFSLSVLVISCPCALGLATPSAIAVACGKSINEGVLIKKPEILEIAHKLKTIIVDKTGTLTENKLSIVEVKEYDSNLYNVLSSLEKHSNHPISKTILEKYNTGSLELEATEIVGEGIVSYNYWVGNLKLAKKYNASIDNRDIEYALNNSYSYVIVGDSEKVLGIIYLADKIKETSKVAVTNLKAKNIDVIMCTGDNQEVASFVSKEVGIENFFSSVKPKDKQVKVDEAKKNGIVAMVGDGINDAIALEDADISITLSSATDIANVSSDVVLLHNNLNDINFLIKLSKVTMKKIKMNLFWALFYNTLLIPLAAGALYYSYGLKLNPMFGAIAMSISSIFVLINSLSISNIKKEEF